MKRRLSFLFFIFSFAVLCGGLPISATAPKTAKIAFWADLGGTRDIYLMNPDGSQRTKITHHPSQNISPVWSPTGEQILFTSDRDGVWDLYLMDPDGTNVQRVFGKTTLRIGAEWSPDGKQIAYMHLIRGEYVVHIATLGEEDEERIAIGGSPTWSPEGNRTCICYRLGNTKDADKSFRPTYRQTENSFSTQGNTVMATYAAMVPKRRQDRLFMAASGTAW